MAEIQIQRIADPNSTPESELADMVYSKLFGLAANNPAFADGIDTAALELSKHLVDNVPAPLMAVLRANPDVVSSQLIQEFYVCVMARASAAVLTLAITKTRGRSVEEVTGLRVDAFVANMRDALSNMLESNEQG